MKKPLKSNKTGREPSKKKTSKAGLEDNKPGIEISNTTSPELFEPLISTEQGKKTILDVIPNSPAKIKQELKEIVASSFLPKKDLFRVDEIASYFSVTDRTIRLWIEHGHLKSEKIVGSIRITRDSVLKCRFNKYI